MQPRRQRCLANLVVHKDRGVVINCINQPRGDHVAVIGKHGHVGIGLKVVEINVGRSQRVARCWIHHRRARRRPLPPLTEHQRILWITSAQGGNAKPVIPRLPQLPIPMQMGVQNAAAANNANSYHGSSLRNEIGRSRDESPNLLISILPKPPTDPSPKLPTLLPWRPSLLRQKFAARVRCQKSGGAASCRFPAKIWCHHSGKWR